MAQVKFVTWLAGLVNKSAPTDNDQMYVGDTGVSKYTTWAQVKAALKTYFDGLYPSGSGNSTGTNTGDQDLSGLAPKGLATGSGLTSNTAKLLGRSSAGTGGLEEIALGTNLSFSGNTLNAAGGGGGGGSPGGSDTQVQYNNAGTFGGASGITTTGTELTIVSGTKTTSTPAFTTTQTWDAAGVAFVAKDNNVTSTASAAGSILEQWRVGGSNKIAFKKEGRINCSILGEAYSGYGELTEVNISSSVGLQIRLNGQGQLGILWDRTVIKGTTYLAWGSGSTDSGSQDTAIYRSAAGVLEINNAAAVGAYRDLKLRNLIGTGNLATGIVTKTADYTATANDGTIAVDASGAARTITLPAVTGLGGRIYVIKKTDSSANAVTVDGNASETIDGAATVVLASQWSTVTIQANAAGTAWVKLSGV